MTKEKLESLDDVTTELIYLRDEVLPDHEGRIKTLEKDLRIEKGKVAKLEDNVATLKTAVGELTKEISTLNTAVGELTKEISKLGEKTATLQKDFDEMKSSYAQDRDCILVGQLVSTWIHEFARQKGENDIWDVQSLRAITGSGGVRDAQLDGEAAKRILGKGNNVGDLTTWFGEVTAYFGGSAHSIIDVRTWKPVTLEGMESILKADGMFQDHTRPIILRVLDDVKQWRQGQTLLTKKAGF